jgi:transposase
MSQPFDLSRFPDLPPEVVKAFGAVQFELSVERAARQHEQAVVAEKEAFITELKALIGRLEGQVQDYRRTKFGPKSEKLDPAQLELALEDLETAIAETQARIAAVEDRIAASEPDPEKKEPCAPRKTRTLMARHGVPIERSVLADWMGRTGALIAPVVDHMTKRLMADSTPLCVDETTAPVLDPGRGKTKTGYLWAVLRDDRGWNGPAPPGVVFHYRPGRNGEYAAEILEGFNGTIQGEEGQQTVQLTVCPTNAYGGYTHLATPKRTGGDPLRLAFCWAHGRRKLIKAKPKKGSPIIDEALLRIAALYKIEDSIRGADPDGRRAVRQNLSHPLVDEFFAWLSAQAARVSRKSDLGVALTYMLKRQDGFRLFLEDGCVDIDSNLVENAIRSPAMNRRNALFAGHDEGGRNWARFASLIGTCKMNGVEPYAYLRDLFTRLANGHLAKDIDDLMPWAYAQQNTISQ